MEYDISQYVQKENAMYKQESSQLKGTDIEDLCGLVGGIPSGQKVRITAVDNAYKIFPIPPYIHRTRIWPYVLTGGAGNCG